MTFSKTDFENIKHIYLLSKNKQLTGSKNTFIAYAHDLEFYKSFLQTNNIDYKNPNIELYMDYITEHYKDNATISRNLSCIRSFYSFLYKNDYIDNKVDRFPKNPKLLDRLPKALGLEEIQKICDIYSSDSPKDIRNKAILELLYSTAARVSEICGLELKDIDFLDSNNKLDFLLITGKGNKQRLVPVGHYAKSALRRYILTARKELLKSKINSSLFIGSLGGKLTRQGIWKIIKEASLLAGVKDVSPHIFRHSAATAMIKAGADIRVVQSMLGHADISTTQIYTRLQKDDLRQVYNLYHPRA